MVLQADVGNQLDKENINKRILEMAKEKELLMTTIMKRKTVLQTRNKELRNAHCHLRRKD